ncbi:MAG TPA: hypothetical protein DCQ77_06810, partial [Betaproteobacteria bacterium]|nr:hypothetical protein [Betaproteobacteria bacterium]
MQRRTQHGFVLIALVALLVMGALAFLISNLSPEFMQAYRQRQTDAALMQAREALIGYALRYRDDQAATGGTNDAMYGFLPMPDVGTSRFNLGGQVSSCKTEGCAMTFNNGAFPAQADTIIGRFPWRTLGTGSLRDGNGECLWYIVSAVHKSLGINPALPMNWDTLGQLDIVVANGTASMQSTLASAHDRPIAIIFSPGPLLDGQDRSNSTTDTVSECGGNYDARNYLDPGTAATLGGITNYFPAATNAANGDTSATPKALSIQGVVQRQSDGKLWSGSCPSGASCGIAANDKGLALTADALFGAIRKNANFRTDINSMLDRMVGCLRDQVAAGNSFTPVAITGNAPSDKLAGHIPSSSCYDNNQNPLGYYGHYQEMVFAAKPNSGTLTVNGDSTCGGVLIFADQRNATQQRITSTDKTTLSNYLEGINLASFTGTGTSFTGDSLFDRSPPQTSDKDIVRCIPAGANLTTVESPNLTLAQQLVAYDPATGTLALGKANVVDGTAGAANLFGCAWLTDNKALGSGLRTYFQFSFATVGTSVGNTGFVFSAIDTESNPTLPCGMAGSHLGYSGDNGFTPKIKFPKLGIEFDQSRNSGFSSGAMELSTNEGRNDPCYTCGVGTADSHAAIVYWGHETANITDGVTRPDNDDNVHGFPTAASLVSVRRPPKNPDTAPGINFVNLRTG